MKITKTQLKQIIKEEIELTKLQPTIDAIFGLVTKEIEKSPEEARGIMWSALMSKIAEAAKEGGSDDSAIEEILGAKRRPVAKNTPLVVAGGRHKKIPNYRYDPVNGVHVRIDYNPRLDYNDELDKAIAKLKQASSLREEETHRCSIGTGEGRWDRSIKSAAECKAAGGKWVDLKKFLGKFGEAREET